MLHESVRNKIHPMISDLESRRVVNWYHFLFHPYPPDPNNAYFHVRFSVLEKSLSYCNYTLNEGTEHAR